MQGKELAVDEATDLAGLQRQFFTSALYEGFEVLAQVESQEAIAPTEGEATPKENPFTAQVRDIRERIMNVRAKETLTATSADELLAAYEPIHQNEALTDRQKLFLEFLLGLGFFEINNRLALKAACIMAENDLDELYFTRDHRVTLSSLAIDDRGKTNSFLGGMEQGAEVAMQIGGMMTEIFGDNDEGIQKYWHLLKSAVDSDETLNELAQKGVSLRHIPARREFLAMAQILHWLGFGGNGEILKTIPTLKDSPLLQHAIGFHSPANTSSFNDRLKTLFGKMLVELRGERTDKIQSLLRKNFPNNEEFKLLDIGAGPALAATGSMAAALSEDGRNVTIDASDMDGANLLNQQVSDSLKEIIGKSIYTDLNQPGLDLGEDQYHSCTASLVLHQLDPQAIPGVLKALVKAAKLNGIIDLFTVGKNAFLQFMLIGANSVDREGSVPSNIFDLVKPSEMAVKTREGYCKVPVPLAEHDNHAPKSIEPGIYQSRLFQIVEVPESILRQLDENRGDPKVMNEIISSHLHAA